MTRTSGALGLAALLLEDNTAGSEHRTRREAAFLAAAGGDRQALEECAGWPELDGTCLNA